MTLIHIGLWETRNHDPHQLDSTHIQTMILKSLRKGVLAGFSDDMMDLLEPGDTVPCRCDSQEFILLSLKFFRFISII